MRRTEADWFCEATLKNANISLTVTERRSCFNLHQAGFTAALLNSTVLVYLPNKPTFWCIFCFYKKSPNVMLNSTQAGRHTGRDLGIFKCSDWKQRNKKTSRSWIIKSIWSPIFLHKHQLFEAFNRYCSSVV